MAALAPEPFYERMDKQRLQELPLVSFTGTIELVDKQRDLVGVVRALRGHRRLGFDTESKPVFRRDQESRPPALVQLASRKKAWLFPLRQLEDPRELFALLADPDIEKVGVAPHDDIKGLQRILDFTAAGFTDLSRIAAERGIQTTGLRNLSGLLLGARVSKSAQVSNWEQNPLTRKQIRYAATDAWVSLRLLEELERRPGRALPLPVEAPAGDEAETTGEGEATDPASLPPARRRA